MPCSRRPVLALCRVSVYVFVSNVRVSMSVSLDTVSLRDLTGMTCLSVYFCASCVRVPMGTRSLACAGPTRPEMRCVHASDGSVLSAGDWLPATTRHLRRLSADQVLGSVWPLSCGTCMHVCLCVIFRMRAHTSYTAICRQQENHTSTRLLTRARRHAATNCTSVAFIQF